MRQPVRCGAIFVLCLLAACHVGAEPILRAFRVDPAAAPGAATRLPVGKALVLAQVFNPDAKTLEPGGFEIGLEIKVGDKTRTYLLKPRASVPEGAIRTFAMIIPEKAAAQDAAIRVFSRQNGKAVYSTKSITTSRSFIAEGITTLYTEAPPEPDDVAPPPEVPFEKGSAPRGPTVAKAPPKALAKAPPKALAKAPTKAPTKTSAVGLVTTSAKTPATAPSKFPTKIPGNTTFTPNSPAPQGIAHAQSSEKPAAPPPRNISDSEFKSLRTIDEELVIYVIKKGDSLASIAQKYYGSASKERIIADLNFIENPNSVKVGEEIIVDVRPLAKSKSGKSRKTSALPSDILPNRACPLTIKPKETIALAWIPMDEGKNA